MKSQNLLSLGLLFFTACGIDFPEGWDDAQNVENLVQSECEGDPYADEEETSTDEEVSAISGSFSDGELQLTYSKAIFRCEQEVAGYHIATDNTTYVGSTWSADQPTHQLTNRPTN